MANSGTYTGTDFYRWAGSSHNNDCLAQGGYATWADGASQAGRAYFSGLSSFDVDKYKITRINISVHFNASGGNYAKWVQFYFSSWADTTYKAAALSTYSSTVDGVSVNAYNATAHMYWDDADTIAKMEKAIRAGNCYICSYNGETASSGYSSHYAHMDGIWISFTYEDRNVFGMSYYTNGNWVIPTEAYCYNGNAQYSIIVPPKALTSNAGENGYSCGATSVWHNAGYEAYHAFDKNTDTNNCWCSAQNVNNTQTIYLTLPRAAMLKSVKITNYTNPNELTGPKAVTINGRLLDDTMQSLISQDGLPGRTAGAVTTINIPEPYNSILIKEISIDITDWQSKGTTGGYLCIGEISAEVSYLWHEIEKVLHYNPEATYPWE